MFDLFKDIDKYQGIPPYASEHYGVYQPLLGWQSNLSKKWIQRGGILIDPRIKRILDGRILPGPNTDSLSLDYMEYLATPLQPGSGRSPYRVVLLKDLNSELLKLVKDSVQTFVDNNNGRLPDHAEWNQIIDINKLMDAENGPLRQANKILSTRLYEDLERKSQGQPITDEMYNAVKKPHLELMQYESQIAAFLLFHAEGHPGFDPDALKKLFSVQVAAPLSDIFLPTDPLANIDPNDRSGALWPIGFVHLFRQYFFDLGTFLGEPVEHVWLAPGTSIELIEVSTRKTIIERTEESAQETTARTEQSEGVKDELSDAVRAENSSNIKLGVSTTNTVSFGVYQGTASASFGVESARKDARETTHKQNREQTEKLSSEIKRSYKSVFKTMTETTDTRSRRYVLQNNGPDLINYELRRKMRRVGVQVQDIGTRLCWQVFIDDAGATLGLAELVHFAESPDLANLKEPEPLPPPANILKKITLPIPFTPIRNYDDNGPGAIYEWRYLETADTQYKGKYLGNRANTNDEDAADSQVIMGPFRYKFDLPQRNYTLTDDIRIIGPQGTKLAQVRGKPTLNPDGSFDLVMQQLNFGGEPSVSLDVELVFAPTADAFNEYDVVRKKAVDKYETEKNQLLRKSFMDSVRERIKDASGIKPRPAWDLREEERTVIYRQLIRRLMLDSWNLPDTNDNRHLSHVRSEVIRAIFDVDSMLYFVAPEWWMPRRHHTRHAYDPDVKVGDIVINLNDADKVKWGDIEKRADNYSITEDSTAAKLGSSLGWLLQLDGDNLRNAFLNAPWVKAVIPIRPGRERAALHWLRSIEGHDKDGWDVPYVGATDEDAALIAAVQADGKEPTIGNVLEKIVEKLEIQNGNIQNVLEADKVFEYGFNPLAGGFDAGVPANQVFSQWISILPTDQIVAVKYEPTSLFAP
jgi:hypothetical protein